MQQTAVHRPLQPGCDDSVVQTLGVERHSAIPADRHWTS